MGGPKILLLAAAALAALALLFGRSRLPIARLFGWLAAAVLALEILAVLALNVGGWIEGVRSADAGQLLSLAVFAAVVWAELALVRWLLVKR